MLYVQQQSSSVQKWCICHTTGDGCGSYFMEGPGLQIRLHTSCGQSASCVGLQARSHQAQPK